MTENLEASSKVPALIDGVPLSPHVLHDAERSLDGTKHLERAHLADHLPEHVLLARVGKAADDAERPHRSPQAHGAGQRVEQVERRLHARNGLRARGLPPGDDGREVRQRGVGPDLCMDFGGLGRVPRLLVLVQRQRVGGQPRGVDVRRVRRRVVGHAAGASAGGELVGAHELRALVVHAGDALAEGELEARGAGDEMRHGEGAGAAGLLLPGVEGGDLADELEDPALAAKVLLEAQTGLDLEALLLARGEQVVVVALQAGRALEGGGGDDVEVEQGRGEEAQGGLVGAPRLVGAGREGYAREQGDGHVLHGGVPVVGLREDLLEDHGGGVEVHVPVVGGGEGDVEDEQLDDALEHAAPLAELVLDAALVDAGHVGAKLAQGEVELVLQAGDGLHAAGGVLDLGAGEDHAEKVRGEAEGGVVEGLVVVEDVEEPAAAALEQSGLVEGEEEGKDVVKVDHDEAEVGVVGEGRRWVGLVGGDGHGGVGRREGCRRRCRCQGCGCGCGRGTRVVGPFRGELAHLIRRGAGGDFVDGRLNGTHLEGRARRVTRSVVYCGRAVGVRRFGRSAVGTECRQGGYLVVAVLGAADVVAVDIEALQVLALAAVVGLDLDLLLEVVGHLLLALAAVHPVGLGLAVVAGDLELGAAVADGAGLVALLAAQATRPAALGAANLGGRGHAVLEARPKTREGRHV
ncbi:hypothetical protein CI238_11090 [Colletotrichum incanum]|uniref:Uncharacterized protein n=1 Tax=Colletotrichum incanum TaxID=1573173 RepID=A0A167BE93_COLIC|nr:hypothetical protein CI238_11090 [Colletotrichum incanum]